MKTALETLISKLRQKVKYCDAGTIASRARKGAYVDAIVIAKELLEVQNQLSDKWIKLKGVENEILNDDIWILVDGKVLFNSMDEFLPIGYASHYMPITKPNPPRQ